MPRASKRRPVWWFVAACVLSMSVLAWAGVRAATEAVERQARARIDASAEASARLVLSNVMAVEQLAESHARHDDVIAAMGTQPSPEFDVPALDRDLQDLLDSRVGLLAAAFLDADGTAVTIVPNDPLIVGRDFSFRDYFEGVSSTNRTYVSEVYLTASPPRHLAVAVATPVRDAARRTAGYIVVTIDVQETQRYVEYFAMAQGVTLLVTDQRGVPIASGEGVTNELVARTEDERVTRALRGDSGIIEEELDDGGAVLSAYRPIPQLGWTVSASIPDSTAYGELSQVRVVVFGSAVLLTALLLGGVFWMLRTLRGYEQGLRDQLEQLERSNRTLVSANRTLDTFSHTLAHDLRNPLTTIGGFAHTLHRISGNQDERFGEMTLHIEESAQRMERLIADVLDLATVSRPEPEREAVDPAEVVRDAAADIEDFDLELGWLPPTISAHRSLLYRSFKNLFENARAYGHAPGERTRVRVSAEETGDEWRFYIDDHGPGVQDADTERIFDAFERGSQQRGTRGTGLGLAIVASCAEAHGGEAWVTDVPDHAGARFVLTLSRQEAADVPGPQ